MPSTTNGKTDELFALLAGVRGGEPTRYQSDPDEADPVVGETADEAWETYQRRGLVNPFHAQELQRRQSEQRAAESDSLMDTLERWDEEADDE